MRMANIGTQRQMNSQTKGTRKCLAVLCACVVWTSGCFTRRAHVAHPPVIRFSAPVVPAAAAGNLLEPPPELEFEAPPAPPQLVTSHSMPARPRVVPPPAPEPPAAEVPAEPTIAPELSAEELTTAKAATQRNLDVAEKNLALAWGRKLNATQQDLVSKVRGFVENAREAMHSGDWERAKNLSKKAEVLSEQLASSL